MYGSPRGTIALTATAASKAFPPSANTSDPTSDANGCALATAPRRPMTTGLAAPPCGPANPGRDIQRQFDVTRAPPPPGWGMQRSLQRIGIVQCPLHTLGAPRRPCQTLR